MERESLVGLTAPHFPTGLTWINSNPLSVAGKITLVDFWTYSCVNCIRTLPYLKQWHEEYGPRGVQIIGVHTPEFHFEKDPENVKRAIRGLGISYPVVLDPDYAIWNLYANHWWPRTLLIGGDGKILYDHIGEGGYTLTEKQIRAALGLETREPERNSAGTGICYPQTPELYLGYERGFIGNPKGFSRDAEVVYAVTPPYARDTVYLQGSWKVTREYIEHTRAREGDSILLLFRGVEVNIVCEKLGGEGTLMISLDDHALLREEAGGDILFEGGESVLRASFPQLLNIVKRKTGEPRLLKITSKDAGVRLYAFTFGGCVE